MELVLKIENGTWSNGTDWDLKPLSLCYKNKSVVVVLEGEKRRNVLNILQYVSKRRPGWIPT